MKYFTSFILFIACILPFSVSAATQSNYPHLANYFLKWDLTEAEAISLARWDVVILDMENQVNNPELIRKIRSINPKVKILAYITSQEIINEADNYNNAFLRQELSNQIIEDWRLKDQNGKAVVNWPFTSMFNLSNQSGRNKDNLLFNEFLPLFIKNKIFSSGLWDGVFYDNTWGDIAWVNNSNIDLNRDGIKDDSKYADSLWSEGFEKMLRLTREYCGPDFIVIGNGRIHWPYQGLLNGMMLESFPSSWENGGTWKGSMESYLKLPSLNKWPNISVININKKNENDYRLFRFGLTSTLLGDGYYSFDYDITNHGQLWWYDEYDVNLGMPQSGPYNILKNGSLTIEPGLWRRDFENGLVVLNSTDKKQNFIFGKEEFEKIKGSQDSKINNGLKINYLSLDSQDGIVLLKKLNAWQGSSFVNGSFLRIFNSDGEQTRNGFFSYITSIPAGSDVILGKFFDDNKIDYIYTNKGLLTLQRDGKSIWTIRPFSPGFTGSASLVVADINGDSSPEIIVGAGSGGGPQVRVFDYNGRSLLNFFAYDKNFRGGVNVGAGDINGDGKAEIITGAGIGGGPHVRYFNESGEFINHFFAYDKNFRGGVKVSAGDLDGDGKAEIVTGDGPGGGSLIKIFDGSGKEKKSFFSFTKDFQNIISVGYSTVSGQPEISVGISGF